MDVNRELSMWHPDNIKQYLMSGINEYTQNVNGHHLQSGTIRFLANKIPDIICDRLQDHIKETK